MAIVCGSPYYRKTSLAMSKKAEGSARVGAGRPSAGGGRYEVYLGTGAEATVVNI